jgi:hypothetical protein
MLNKEEAMKKRVSLNMLKKEAAMKKRLSLNIFAVLMTTLLAFSGSASVTPPPVQAFFGDGHEEITHAIAAGDGRFLAIRRDGTPWAWERNDHRQIGDGITTPRQTPAQVTASAGTLSLSTTRVRPGENISVTFSGFATTDTGWIGFYKEGADDRAFISWRYLRDLTDQTFTVQAPKELGSYNFRIFRDAGYTRLGTSFASLHKRRSLQMGQVFV